MSDTPVSLPQHVREVDPRDLIREAYRIEGISLPDCRTVFLDWSLGDMGAVPTQEAVTRLLAHYGTRDPEHPMTLVLRSATAEAPSPQRRGGAKARRQD